MAGCRYSDQTGHHRQSVLLPALPDRDFGFRYDRSSCPPTSSEYARLGDREFWGSLLARVVVAATIDGWLDTEAATVRADAVG